MKKKGIHDKNKNTDNQARIEVFKDIEGVFIYMSP